MWQERGEEKPSEEDMGTSGDAEKPAKVRLWLAEMGTPAGSSAVFSNSLANSEDHPNVSDADSLAAHQLDGKKRKE